MSSIYPKGNRLYFRVKVGAKWKGVATAFKVGQERAARAMLARLDARRAVGAEAIGDVGPVTLEKYSTTWLKARAAEVQTWRNNDSDMRLHVLPTLGQLRLDEVRPHHLVRLVASWRARREEERMAPKSIYNAYSTVSALFRDACLEDLLPSSPCILTKRQLGPKVDGDPEWRPKALFTAAELELLISDERVPMDRRVMYALLGIAGLRYGEASGLLWRNVNAEPQTPPLGMLFVAFSYERPMPKGDVCRPVPIHPTLAAVLAEWKLAGWAKLMGRAPEPGDLVLPLPPDAVSKLGRWRRKAFIRKFLKRDLEQLGLRHRRGHDLRRTMISLARSAGAEKDILKRATHKPPREVIEGYTTFEWPVVCREVLKLDVHRQQTGKVLAIPRATAVGDELATGLLPAVANRSDDSEIGVALPGLEPRRSASEDTGATRSSDPVSARSTVCETCGQPSTSNRHGSPSTSGSKVASPAELGRRARALLAQARSDRKAPRSFVLPVDRAKRERLGGFLREIGGGQ